MKKEKQISSFMLFSTRDLGNKRKPSVRVIIYVIGFLPNMKSELSLHDEKNDDSSMQVSFQYIPPVSIMQVSMPSKLHFVNQKEFVNTHSNRKIIIKEKSNYNTFAIEIQPTHTLVTDINRRKCLAVEATL